MVVGDVQRGPQAVAVTADPRLKAALRAPCEIAEYPRDACVQPPFFRYTRALAGSGRNAMDPGGRTIDAACDGAGTQSRIPSPAIRSGTSRGEHMERRSFIKNTGLAGILAAGTAPAFAQPPTDQVALASSFPKSLDTIYGAAEIVAKRVAEVDRRQVPDPGLRRRRNRARPAGARRRAERHRRVRPHRAATTTSARTRPSPSAPPCRSA